MFSSTLTNRTYDNISDEYQDHINNLIKYYILPEFQSQRSEISQNTEITPIISNSIRYLFNDTLNSKFNKNLAEIACTFVYSGGQNNEDYEEFVKDSITKFFTEDKQTKKYNSEMAITDLIEDILNGISLDQTFCKLHYHSLVVSISLAASNQSIKTVDTFYPDDKDYHFYSNIIDGTNDYIEQIKSNLEDELEELYLPISLDCDNEFI